MIRNQTKPRQLTFDGITDHVTLWVELKRAYGDLRGADVGPNRKLVPRTTNADVLQLAERWTKELRKAKDKRSYSRAKADWQKCLDEVARLARGADPGAVYAHNQQFWQRYTARLAIHLESVKGLPSRWDLAVESIKESVAELPDRAVDVARGTGQAAKAAAKGAGSIIETLTKPIVLAGVVIGGVLLLPALLRD